MAQETTNGEKLMDDTSQDKKTAHDNTTSWLVSLKGKSASREDVEKLIRLIYELRSVIRVEYMPKEYDIADDATTELAVELAYAQERICELEGRFKR